MTHFGSRNETVVCVYLKNEYHVELLYQQIAWICAVVNEFLHFDKKNKKKSLCNVTAWNK